MNTQVPALRLLVMLVDAAPSPPNKKTQPGTDHHLVCVPAVSHMQLHFTHSISQPAEEQAGLSAPFSQLHLHLLYVMNSEC